MNLEEHRTAAPRQLTVSVVTLSDRRDASGDTSGEAIRAALVAAGHVVRGPRILREDPSTLRDDLAAAVAETGVDAVIVNGGTGIAPRDRAFDVLATLYTRPLPGFGELFRALSYAEIGSAALLSRASAGVVGDRLVFSVPGSRAAVQLALAKLILPELGHAVGELRRSAEPA
jgi:molybdenum cofactor biosynthesis protein B